MDKAALKRLALARDIETAFKNYLGTDSFPTEEWPAVALAFARVVESTGHIETYGAPGDPALTRQLLRDCAALQTLLAELVGL